MHLTSFLQCNYLTTRIVTTRKSPRDSVCLGLICGLNSQKVALMSVLSTQNTASWERFKMSEANKGPGLNFRAYRLVLLACCNPRDKDLTKKITRKSTVTDNRPKMGPEGYQKDAEMGCPNEWCSCCNWWCRKEWWCSTLDCPKSVQRLPKDWLFQLEKSWEDGDWEVDIAEDVWKNVLQYEFPRVGDWFGGCRGW